MAISFTAALHDNLVANRARLLVQLHPQESIDIPERPAPTEEERAIEYATSGADIDWESREYEAVTDGDVKNEDGFSWKAHYAQEHIDAVCNETPEWAIGPKGSEY